jgi:hypothetical protein
MRRRLIAPVVLFALLAGLASGPHPCHATEARRAMPAMSSMSSMPSMPHCAAMTGAAEAPEAISVHAPARGCCRLPGSSPGDAAQCERNCSLLAVLYRAPALSPSGAAHALPVPDRELHLSRFSLTIDHIPL